MIAQGYMQFSFFPSLVAIQIYFVPTARSLLFSYVDELECEPYIISISVLLTLLLILVERKMDTREEKLSYDQSCLERHIVIYFVLAFTL